MPMKLLGAFGKGALLHAPVPSSPAAAKLANEERPPPGRLAAGRAQDALAACKAPSTQL